MMIGRFSLIRHEDVTGVSGPGRVGRGVFLGPAGAVLRWRAPYRTVVWYPRGEYVQQLHGHDGKTTVERGW
jgi:hypothetical protein